MKVLLINPPTSNLYAKIGNNMPPLGLAYLAAVLRKSGHWVEIIDLCIEPKALSKLSSNNFDLVGISADTPRFPAAVAIAKEAKKKNSIIVMGGYHVTFMDEEALKTRVVDYVVRGEGEESFLNLVNAIEEGSDPKDIHGLSYSDGNSTIRTKEAFPPSDLDHLPIPARDLLPLAKYNATLRGMPMANLITSRGCPFNCYFCASSRFGGLKWRARSPSSIADEIEQVYNEFGYHSFAFMDDNFTLNPKRVIEFADELDRRGININWWCFSRVDTLAKNEFLVKRMAESGARMVFLGLESSSEQVLKDYRKGIKTDQAQQAIELLTKYGINIYGSFIIGAIHETKKMILHTISWAKKLNPHTVQFSILTPYPGTDLFEQVVKENRLLHRHWEFFDAAHSVIKTDYLLPSQIQKLLAKAYRKFYFSPSYILHFSQEGLKNKNLMQSMIKSIKFLLTFLSLSFIKHPIKNQINNKYLIGVVPKLINRAK